MKGLLLKDWYVMLRQCRLHAVLIVAMAVLYGALDVGPAVLMYPMLFAGMIPTFILSHEERSGWEKYQETLPVSRRTVVTEKYIAAFISVCAAAVLIGLSWSVRLAFQGGGDLHQLPRVLVQLVIFGMLFPAFSLPAMLRLGVEKGRFVAALLSGVGACAIVWVSLRTAMIPQPDLATLMGWNLPLMLMIGAVVLAASWLLAVRLYESREL